MNLIFATILSLFFFPWYTPTQEKQSYVVEWAKENLPQIGILQENRDGYVYLKVDNAFVDQIYPRLTNPLYKQAVSTRRLNSLGAHISVFYPQERSGTGDIEEVGQWFSFSIKRLAYVPPKSRKFIVLEVTSPSLEHLRKKYGLPPLLKGHPFHITIAKKRW